MPNPNPRLTARIDALPQTLRDLLAQSAVRSLIAEVDVQRDSLQSLKPLQGMEQAALDQYDNDWLARYTYNSNAIEGSTLTLQDTELVLSGEFVPEDSPARYVFAAKGVADGMQYVRQYAKENRHIDTALVRRLHEITALDLQPASRGQFRPAGFNARITGTSVKTADPLEIWDDLDLLFSRLDDSDAPMPLKAAGFHAMFENIHPFADGNGRTGRQVLNLMLMEAGYRPVAIKYDAGRSYGKSLEQWQVYNNPSPFVTSLLEGLRDEQQEVIDMIQEVRASLQIDGTSKDI
jgi:Fic family protein